jgi:hypothetical protein
VWDNNGIWHEETYNQPQSGLMGALNILNQFQSYNNYRRQRARETEADLSNVATMGEKHGQDLYSTPEGGEAASTLGISPDTTGNVFTSIPQQKLKARIAAMQAQHPDTPLSGDELSSAYAQEGQAPPTNVIRSEAESRKERTARFTRMNRAMTDVMKLYVNQGMPEDQARKATVDFVHGQGYGGDEWPEEETRLAQFQSTASTQVAPKAGAQVERTEAQTGELTARTGKEAAQAATIDAMRDPQVAAEYAKAGLSRARAAALGLDQKMKQIKLDQGGMTPTSKAAINMHIAQLEKEIGDAKAGMQFSAAPAAVKAKIKQLETYADNQRELIGEARIHGPAPKMGKYVPGKSYTNSKTGQTAIADELGNLPESGPPAQ